MKLFLIIYSAGHIGGAIGPVPYDIAECNQKVAEMLAKQQHALDTNMNKDGVTLTPEMRKSIEELSFKCEYHETRPALGSPQ